MNGAYTVDARDLTCRYGPLKAVDRFTLQVPSGTVYGLVGPNGSGKSTLVKTLCGLKKPAGGSASVMGCDIVKDATRLRHTLGYMSQKFCLYDELTTAENIEFFAKAHGVVGREGARRIEEVVALTKLGPHMDKMAEELSGGWRQRLALATTILHRPPLMFLDEPTAGIDPVARRELWDLLFALAAEGHDIFLTTQYMDEVERCGEVGYLYLSKLIVSGTPEALKVNPLVAGDDMRYIELHCTNAIHAVPWLRQRPYCQDATIFGTSVHACVKNAFSDTRIHQDCEAAGMTKVTVRTIEPTLEDVFVALTRHAAEQRAQERANA